MFLFCHDEGGWGSVYRQFDVHFAQERAASAQSCRRQRRIRARRGAKRSSGLDTRIPKPRQGWRRRWPTSPAVALANLNIHHSVGRHGDLLFFRNALPGVPRLLHSGLYCAAPPVLRIDCAVIGILRSQPYQCSWKRSDCIVTAQQILIRRMAICKSRETPPAAQSPRANKPWQPLAAD